MSGVATATAFASTGNMYGNSPIVLGYPQQHIGGFPNRWGRDHCGIPHRGDSCGPVGFSGKPHSGSKIFINARGEKVTISESRQGLNTTKTTTIVGRFGKLAQSYASNGRQVAVASAGSGIYANQNYKYQTAVPGPQLSGAFPPIA